MLPFYKGWQGFCTLKHADIERREERRERGGGRKGGHKLQSVSKYPAMCHHAVMNHTDVQKAHEFVMCWLSWDWLVSSWKLIDTSNPVASKLCLMFRVLSKTNLPTHLTWYLPNLVIRRDLCDLLHCHPTDSFSEVSGASCPHASHPLETELGTSKPVVCR